MFKYLKRCVAFSLLLVLIKTTSAQEQISELPFNASELLHYDVFYNLGFIWINAATVDFEIDSASYENKHALKLCSSGKSLDAYNWIMEVSGSYSSIVNSKNLKPLKHLRDTREDDFHLQNQYTFDHSDSVIYCEMEDSNTPIRFDTLELLPDAADLVATAYQIRSLNFNDYRLHDSIPFKIVLGAEYHDIFIRFLGYDNCETRNGNMYRCLKFSAVLAAGTIFEGEEEMIVWVTNDRNKVPVMVEAKILVGSVKASLNYTKGLKYPVEARLTN
jgi:hypothetical protein